MDIKRRGFIKGLIAVPVVASVKAPSVIEAMSPDLDADADVVHIKGKGGTVKVVRMTITDSMSETLDSDELAGFTDSVVAKYTK